jgi:hypothetical protein
LREFDLRSLLKALHEAGVDFIVIGGVAVGAHGFIRGTEDLDVVPDPDPDNLERLADVLDELESRLPTADNRLDVVQRARGVPSYAQLTEDAVDSDLLGIPVRVCSLARLREMKEAQNRTQDKLDLENLPED